MPTISGRLSQILEKKAPAGKNYMTARQLSELSGVSQGSISKFLSGTSEPSADNIARICKALDISSDYLLGLSDVEKIDTKIDALGIDEAAFEGLTNLYGNNPVSRRIMNSFLKVFADAELSQSFTETLFDFVNKLIYDSGFERKNRKLAKELGIPYKNKVSLKEHAPKNIVKREQYDLYYVFSNEIITNFADEIYKHFRRIGNTAGGFIGYTADEKKDDAETYYRIFAPSEPNYYHEPGYLFYLDDLPMYVKECEVEYTPDEIDALNDEISDKYKGKRMTPIETMEFLTGILKRKNELTDDFDEWNEDEKRQIGIEKKLDENQKKRNELFDELSKNPPTEEQTKIIDEIKELMIEDTKLDHELLGKNESEVTNNADEEE